MAQRILIDLTDFQGQGLVGDFTSYGFEGHFLSGSSTCLLDQEDMWQSIASLVV